MIRKMNYIILQKNILINLPIILLKKRDLRKKQLFYIVEI